MEVNGLLMALVVIVLHPQHLSHSLAEFLNCVTVDHEEGLHSTLVELTTVLELIEKAMGSCLGKRRKEKSA